MAVVLRAGGVDALATEAKCFIPAVEVDISSVIGFLLSYAVESTGCKIRLGDGDYLEAAAAGDTLAIWLAVGYPRS